MKESVKLILIAFLGIAVLALFDIVVLERIYHPLSSAYNIPWSALYVSPSIEFIWWHVAFLPLGFVIFGLLGWAAKSWKLFFSGSILVLTGWEDIFYYTFRGNWLPETLAWLNLNPVMALMNLILPGEDVTRLCVIVAAILGLVAIYFMFYGNKKKKGKR